MNEDETPSMNEIINSDVEWALASLVVEKRDTTAKAFSQRLSTGRGPKAAEQILGPTGLDLPTYIERDKLHYVVGAFQKSFLKHQFVMSQKGQQSLIALWKKAGRDCGSEFVLIRLGQLNNLKTKEK